MVANEAGATNGTGAQLQLKSADGSVVDTYTLIIFGDVDGTGAVDASDTLPIKQYVADSVANSLSDVQLFAADIDASSAVDASDTLPIMQYVADSVANALPVNPYAA